MIEVFLVDDHELVINSVAVLLGAQQDISVVGIAYCGEKALETLETISPDIIFVDIEMPGIGGMETCRRVLKKQPNIKIIVLSVHNDGPIPQQLMKLGAVGFVSKASSVDEMIEAVRTVMTGEQYLCPNVAENMIAQAKEAKKDSPFLKLSQREQEVVGLILQGKSIKEMAEQLALSDKTINTYRYRLYDKLSVRNDVDLTYLASKHNYTGH